MEKKTMQRLHGNYSVQVGETVTPDTKIGTADGWMPNQRGASHDHASIGVGSTPTHSGWYDGCNNTDNPMNYLQGIDNNDINAHFVFNPDKGWGGYGYLQQTVYNWYTDCRDNTLHDGIDFFAPLNSTLYAGVYGTVTDVGYQSNGLTYCYIEIEDQLNNDSIIIDGDYQGLAEATEQLRIYKDSEFNDFDRVFEVGEKFYYKSFNNGWVVTQRSANGHEWTRFLKHNAQDYFKIIEAK